ncbi:MAG TPA: hypothetical protein VF720_14550 [Candidatus Eisenbacteria bacterium]
MTDIMSAVAPPLPPKATVGPAVMSLRPPSRPLQLITLFLAAMFLTSCGDDDDPPDPEPVAMIRGQIERGGGYIGAPDRLAPEGLPSPTHLVGAVVTVERIDDDGNFIDVTADTAVSDQNGRFVVSVNADGEADLVVAAVRDNERYKALVSRPVRADSTVVVAPLNDETTGEAEIWAWLQDHPQLGSIPRPDVSLDVNSSVAAIVITGAELVASAGDAIAGQVEAVDRFHLEEKVGTSAIGLAAARTARRAALVRLDEDLDTALDPSNENQARTIHAHEAWFVREREAWTMNGIRPEVLAVAREAGMREYRRRAASARSDLKRVMSEAAALQRARTMAAAVDTLLEMAGVSPAGLSTVAMAGVTLRNSMYGIGSDAAILAEFNAYENTVVNVMAAAFPGTAANEQLAHTQLVLPGGGAQDNLMIFLSGADTAEKVAGAYAEFYGLAEDQAFGVLSNGNVPEASRRPFARALMLVVMPI